MPAAPNVTVERPDHQALALYGWLLGQADPLQPKPLGFYSPASDFWHEHLFDAGTGGDTEMLWVSYRDNSSVVAKLEVHHKTEQAVVPLTQAITQILCLSDADGTPDLTTLRAFRLSPGIGICMRPGVWHTTRADDATCLMLTRRSTTLDLVAHLVEGQPAQESASATIPKLRLVAATDQ